MRIEVKKTDSGAHYIEIGYGQDTFKLAGIFSEMGARIEYNRLHNAIMAYSAEIKNNSRRR
jgi:hypothetical protein